MQLIKNNLKSNKGFTMQDLVIAIIIITILAGTVGSVYILIYEVQGETQIDALATLYTIQAVEYMDKVSYDEVNNGMEEQIKSQINLPSAFEIAINVTETPIEERLKTVSEGQTEVKNDVTQEEQANIQNTDEQVQGEQANVQNTAEQVQGEQANVQNTAEQAQEETQTNTQNIEGRAQEEAQTNTQNIEGQTQEEQKNGETQITYIKQVKTVISYTFKGKNKNITIDRLKVKEL